MNKQPSSPYRAPPPTLVPTPGLLLLLFGLRAPVSRRSYVMAGGCLFLLKYTLESLYFSRLLGRPLTPEEFLGPFFIGRAALVQQLSIGGGWVLLGLQLPFLWIGLTMSVRRALMAGLRPWWGFLFLVPLVNYLLIALLVALPDRAAKASPAESPVESDVLTRHNTGFLRALRAALFGALFGLGMVGVCVYQFRSYGAVLFIATPIMVGFVSAAIATRLSHLDSLPARRERWLALQAAIMSAVLIVALVLLSGVEGGMCLLMAVIPGLPCLLVGALVGIRLGKGAGHVGMVLDRKDFGAIVLFPLAALGEAQVAEAPELVRTSSVIIEAPPEVVWRHVVRFDPLPEPTEALFRAGIAYPKSARIEGEGVGAVRYCEFSTGAFVEPITSWDAPHRLAFDVTENPPPMRELSPYELVDAPHLNGFMRSKRGEFRLVPLEGGRTRLEGTTVYALEIFPSTYWQLWTDHIVGKIHHRVLTHIKAEAEAEL